MRRTAVLCAFSLLLAATSLSAQTLDVVFVNRTGATLYFLYASPTTADSWGDDLLGNRILGAGETYRVRLVTSGGSYDIRAVDSNENEYIIWSYDLDSTPRVVLQPADYVGLHSQLGGEGVLAWLDIVNETNYTIFEVHIAPASSPDWNEGPQLLKERQVIHDGETYRIEIDIDAYGTYVYDIMLIDEEGDRYVKWDVNLELATRVIYTLDDLDWD